MKTVIVKKLSCAALAAAMLAGTSSYAASANELETKIHIVHTNDIHGYYKATTSGQVGFEAVKEIVDSENADLVLDAGDTFHGQSFATAEEGESIAELMDSVGYDAVSPGNHDWSYGADRLIQLDKESDFSVLAANVTDENGDNCFENRYIVKTVTADDGTELRVGVLGVIDDKFYDSTASRNVKGLTFSEEASVASDIAGVLRSEENCDIVIAITHNADPEGFTANTSGIDAVIAGHEHVLKDESCADKDGKQVKIVEAGYYMLDVGVLTLTYDSEQGVTAAVEKNYTSADTVGMSNEAIAAEISSIEAREQSVLSEVICESSESYDYVWEDVRTQETEIGRIVTAAYLDYTGADVAMENAGGIRGGIPRGNVTYSDLISISPYGNVLVEKELTGAQLIEILEYSIDLMKQCGDIYEAQKQAAANGDDPYQYSWPSNSGSVLQFGGISADYDLNKPYGERTENIKIGGEDIVPDKTYRVVMNNYVAENTSYPAISSAALAAEYTTCEQVLRSYFEKGLFEQAAHTANLVEKKSDDSQQIQPTTGESTAPSAQPSVSQAGESSTDPSSSTRDQAVASESTPSNASYDQNALQTSGIVLTIVFVSAVVSVGVVYVLSERKRKNK